MVAHLVLYRPKPGLDRQARDRFTESIVAARREIPAIRRFTVGRRMANPPAYRVGPFPDFPYMAFIEFEDRAGLMTYLEHPTHAGLGQAFNQSLDAALVYDFETADASEADKLSLR